MRVVMLLLSVFSLVSLSDAQVAKVVVTPNVSDALFSNPGMGWQTFGRFADDDLNLEGIPSGSAYFRFYWSRVEPEEGQIDFALFDSLLVRAHNAGQKLAFRIMCAGTNNDYMHVPAWLKEKGCPGFEYKRGEDTVLHWVPDMESPMFREAHDRLIRELGQRYDGHADLDHVDIGSVGLWGEWHMSGTGVDMPTEKTRREIVDLYLTSFPKTPKVMLIGDEGCMRYAVSKGCGWRADCLGDMGGFSKTWNHMENMYPEQVRKTGAENAWQAGPVAFETCWTMQKWSDEGWCIECIFDYAIDYHASYVNNKSSKIPPGSRPEIERLLKKLGYRITLNRVEHDRSVKRGASLAVSADWENRGCAPSYRDYRIVWKLEWEGRSCTMPTAFSIKGLLPGKVTKQEMLAVPADLAPGKYTLSVGVVDPATGVPAVNLAIEGAGADRWYTVSSVEVVR